jgi:hypothetical protein
MQPTAHIDLVDQWSQVKKRILNPGPGPDGRVPPANPERDEGYKKVFANLDQNLSGKLRAVDRAAAAARNGDPKARAKYRAALQEAFDTIEDYNKYLDMIGPAFIEKYGAQGSWSILRHVLNKIRDDIGMTLAALPR